MVFYQPPAMEEVADALFPNGDFHPFGNESTIILSLLLGAVFIDRMRKRNKSKKPTGQ